MIKNIGDAPRSVDFCASLLIFLGPNVGSGIVCLHAVVQKAQLTYAKKRFEIASFTLH